MHILGIAGSIDVIDCDRTVNSQVFIHGVEIWRIIDSAAIK